MTNGPYIIGLAAFAFVALLGAAFATDALFAQHMSVLFFVLAASTIVHAAPRKLGAGRPGRSFDLHGRPDPLRRRSPPCSGASSASSSASSSRCSSPIPDLNLEPWFNFGRLRPLHTSAVIFAFGGNALIATSLLRRAAHLPRAAVRRQPRLVRVLGLPALHRAGRDRLPARRHPVAANTPSRNGTSTSG